MTRAPILILLALSFAAAGCFTPSDEGAAGGDDNATGPTDGMPTATGVPPPIEDSQDVQGSADPLNFAMMPPCSSPTAQCFRYPFTLNSTATITAEVLWSVPASDFDLYVFQDGAQIDDGQGASPPGTPATSETIEQEFEAGEYELVVVAWSVAQDTFIVMATFSAARAAANGSVIS